jgi:hypothetical protein
MIKEIPVREVLRTPAVKKFRRLWPVLIALILVLFPFDWLGQVWPTYGQIFDVVFATAQAHHIGHVTIFFIAGLLALFAFPSLRARPVLYIVLMMLGAVGEEALQALFKFQLPTLGDGRDLLFDLAGFVIAYSVVLLAQWIAKRSQKR